MHGRGHLKEWRTDGKSLGINVLRDPGIGREDGPGGPVQKTTPWRDRFASEQGRLGFCCGIGSSLQNALQEPQGLKALRENEYLIAALKALRHPEASSPATV